MPPQPPQRRTDRCADWEWPAWRQTPAQACAVSHRSRIGLRRRAAPAFAGCYVLLRPDIMPARQTAAVTAARAAHRHRWPPSMIAGMPHVDTRLVVRTTPAGLHRCWRGLHRLPWLRAGGGERVDVVRRRADDLQAAAQCAAIRAASWPVAPSTARVVNAGLAVAVQKPVIRPRLGAAPVQARRWWRWKNATMTPRISSSTVSTTICLTASIPGIGCTA